MAELSWLGNLWDSLTKREEKPTGNGILNYQPEIKPTKDIGILGSILGPTGRALQSAEAELPRSFVPSDPQYTPLVSESKFIYNKLLGEPIASLGEGMEGVAQGIRSDARTSSRVPRQSRRYLGIHCEGEDPPAPHREQERRRRAA